VWREVFTRGHPSHPTKATPREGGACRGRRPGLPWTIRFFSLYKILLATLNRLAYNIEYANSVRRAFQKESKGPRIARDARDANGRRVVRRGWPVRPRAPARGSAMPAPGTPLCTAGCADRAGARGSDGAPSARMCCPRIVARGRRDRDERPSAERPSAASGIMLRLTSAYRT
jgi:hypothetical protein